MLWNLLSDSKFHIKLNCLPIVFRPLKWRQKKKKIMTEILGSSVRWVVASFVKSKGACHSIFIFTFSVLIYEIYIHVFFPCFVSVLRWSFFMSWCRIYFLSCLLLPWAKLQTKKRGSKEIKHIKKCFFFALPFSNTKKKLTRRIYCYPYYLDRNVFFLFDLLPVCFFLYN